MNIFYEIEKLICYGIKYSLIKKEDKILLTNQLLEILDIDEYTSFSDIELQNIDTELENIIYPTDILDNIVNWAIKNNKLKDNSITFQDIFNSKIMGYIIPRSSEVINEFYRLFSISSNKATDFYYNFSKQSNYIRTDRIKKDIHWKYSSLYGELDITINFSKPEKDPKEIMLAKSTPTKSYPKCLLCKENEGYEGRINHPGRQNHRIIPLELHNETWYLQYSPYIYYNEHCIVLSKEHRPMKIDKNTFKTLLDFVELFPHYFIGSNADLPIVGGSILSHDHFQGGNYTFPMALADIKEKIFFKDFPDIEAGILNWPLSVIRLKGSKEDIIELSGLILNKWIVHSDSENNIISYTNKERHNTITPIARYKDSKFELDLVLRNNRTTNEHPLGIFHPHSEYHNIKKENIGLIEVMGLAVLPGRLKEEMNSLKEVLLIDPTLNFIDENDILYKHKKWCENFILVHKINSENIDSVINNAIGETFSKVLENCGVFKTDTKGNEGFKNFLNACM